MYKLKDPDSYRIEARPLKGKQPNEWATKKFILRFHQKDLTFEKKCGIIITKELS